MLDPISLVVGAAILGAGWAAGRFQRPARQRSAYTCTCDHPLSDHDRTSGACHGVIVDEDAYSPEGRSLGVQRIPCTCRQYVGEYPVDITTLGLPGMPHRTDLEEKLLADRPVHGHRTDLEEKR